MNIVIKVDEAGKQKMIEYYKDKVRDKKIPYVVFQAEEEDTVITMYESGKVMFQGTSADVDASMWQTMLNIPTDAEIKSKENHKKYYYCNSIGSDEVGTGDYFGPIVVTATYVTKEDIPFLESLGIRDSKKITDEMILKVAPQVAKRIKYRSVILTNPEYNEKYTKDVNMNKIKAILHNKVLYQLIHEENPTYDYIIVDEFAHESKYYDYLKEVNPIQRGLTFFPKAEDQNLAVACGSVISRYLFLKEFDKLSDTLQIPLPKGAGKEVDEIGKEVVAKYGKEKLSEIAKLNFKNTDRILDTLIF